MGIFIVLLVPVSTNEKGGYNKIEVVTSVYYRILLVRGGGHFRNYVVHAYVYSHDTI